MHRRLELRSPCLHFPSTCGCPNRLTSSCRLPRTRGYGFHHLIVVFCEWQENWIADAGIEPFLDTILDLARIARNRHAVDDLVADESHRILDAIRARRP